MSKKIKPKKRKFNFGQLILSVIGISLITFFLSNGISEVMTTVKLNKNLELVEEELKTLEARQSELTLEKSKLEDPNYVQNYARGAHLLSKSEEQVFILPKSNDD